MQAKLAAGNWKMNGLGAELAEIFALGNVAGALVGGASKQAKDFAQIAKALSISV